MGGFGSGPQHWRKKSVVESCLALDTADLLRWGYLRPAVDKVGTFSWRRKSDPESDSSVGFALRTGAADGVLRLDYRLPATGEKFDYGVRLVTTSCQFGGRRWWFICPLVAGGSACGRRVRKVYLRGNYFGCRHCHRLSYTSTQESDKRVYAALRGGLDFGALGDLGGRSVAELGFLLKVLGHEQRKLDRIGRRAGG